MGLTSAGALIVFIILTALLGANLLLIFLLIRQRKKSERQRDDIEEKDTRIEELQTSIALSQIKPHFLYNSLNTIYVLCGKDLSKGRQAISDLSDYLRSNIGSIDSRLPIPFEEEMEHVKKYLALEELRFPDEFTVSYVTPVTGFSLPALTIQPLVENAVRHGVVQRGEGGIILISTRETDTHYIVSISDNGPGFEPDSAASPDQGQSGGEHIGIRNVRERLKRLCRGELEIRSTPGYGTEAIIRIPKNPVLP